MNNKMINYIKQKLEKHKKKHTMYSKITSDRNWRNTRKKAQNV